MTTTQLISDHALIAIGFRLACAEKSNVDMGNVDIESTLLDIIRAFREDY